MVRLFRLCSSAPARMSAFPLPLRRVRGTGTVSSPRRYRAVRARLSARNASRGAAQTTSPPFSPDQGPSSTTWSAARIICGSCSTTTTVLPASARSRRIYASVEVSRVRFEPAAPAGDAGERAAIPAEKDPHVQLVPLLLEIVEELLDSLELLLALPEQRPLLVRQLGVGRRQTDSAPLHRQQHLPLPPVRAGLGPGLDGAFRQRAMAVGDDQILVIPKDVAEALAVRTGAQGMIEREHHRPDRLESPSATLALVAEAIRLRRVADHVHPADAVALSERGFHPLDQATSVLATEHQPIQDHMEIRPVRPGEQGAGVKV